MGNENEDNSACEAFNRLYNTIKDLQKIESSVKYQNVSALEKCKKEIESLLGEAGDISS
jgi:hypothetical protein